MKTKIAVTADIHFGTHADGVKLKNLVRTLEKNDIEYLVIAGDLVSRGADHPSCITALEILSEYSGTILLTPGNHDLWTTPEGSSFHIWKKTLPSLLRHYGHRMLDGNPFVINTTGVVGTIGWYDYSFRNVPPHIEASFENAVFEFTDEESGTRRIPWREIQNSDYIGKRSKISTDGKNWKISTWQDKKFIRWEWTDEEFLTICLNQLREDIESIYDEVDDIIVVTHHLPFLDFVPDIPDPTWSFHRAYLGSASMGELILKYGKINHVFSGHVHRKIETQIGAIKGFTSFFHAAPGLHVITIEE